MQILHPPKRAEKAGGQRKIENELTSDWSLLNQLLKAIIYIVQYRLLAKGNRDTYYSALGKCVTLPRDATPNWVHASGCARAGVSTRPRRRA